MPQPKGLRKGPFNPNKPEQLQMLMTPSEIKKSINFSVDGQPRGEGEVWDEKRVTNISDRNKNGDMSLMGRIARNGVSVPVVLQHKQFGQHDSQSSQIGMGNGHHRVEAAAQLHAEAKILTGDKKMQEPHIPVVHDDDYMGGSSDMAKSFPRVYHSGTDFYDH